MGKNFLESFLDDVSMRHHQIREHITPLIGYINPPNTVSKEQVPDVIGELLSIFLTTKLKKYQQLQGLPRYNNYRGGGQNLSRNNISEGGGFMAQHVNMDLGSTMQH